jgi:hypothetical protein
MTEPLEYEGKPALPPQAPKGAMQAIFRSSCPISSASASSSALPFYAAVPRIGPANWLMFAVYSLCQLIGSLWGSSDRIGRGQFDHLTARQRDGLSDPRGRRRVSWANPLPGCCWFTCHASSTGSAAETYQPRRRMSATTPKDRGQGDGDLGARSASLLHRPRLGRTADIFIAAARAGGSGVQLAAAIMTIVRLRECRHSHESDDEVLLWLHPARFCRSCNRTILQMLGIVPDDERVRHARIRLRDFPDDRFGFQELQVGGFFAFVGFTIIIVQGGLSVGWPNASGNGTGDHWSLLVALAMTLYVLVGRNGSIAVSSGVMLIPLAGFFNASGRSIQTLSLSPRQSAN